MKILVIGLWPYKFREEEKYKEIGDYIYKFLSNNKDNKKYNFERYGKLINAVKYLDIIKTDNEPIGDLELSTFSLLFNVDIYLFELKDDKNIYIISECDKIENKEINKNKLFINLCFVKGNRLKVIYEKNRNKNLICNIEDINKLIEQKMEKKDSLELKFEYPKDKKYRDLEIF